MGRNERRNKHRKSWNNQSQGNQFNQNLTLEQQRNFQLKSQRNFQEEQEEREQKESAILEFKSRQVVCAKCGEVILDMTSAISNPDGKPVHFDCVLDSLKEKENMLPGQQMTYIGNGRFAVVSFENPRDLRKFKIEKVIEYEDKSKPIDWRDEMATLYSQTK